MIPIIAVQTKEENKLPPSTRKRSVRRRTQRNFAVIPRDFTFALGTLANDTVVFETSPITLEQDLQFVSGDFWCSYNNHTAGEGPLEIGLATEDLTVTEVEEALEAQPLSQFDVPAIEHARRPVRTIGVFPGLATEETLNDGKSIRKRLTVQIPAGKALPKIWVMNRSGAALTTGTIVHIRGKWYGRWK